MTSQRGVSVGDLKASDPQFVTARLGEVQHRNPGTGTPFYFMPVDSRSGRGVHYSIPELFDESDPDAVVTIWYSGPRTVDGIAGTIRGLAVKDRVLRYQTAEQHARSEAERQARLSEGRAGEIREKAVAYVLDVNGVRSTATRTYMGLDPRLRAAIDTRIKRWGQTYGVTQFASDVEFLGKVQVVLEFAEQQSGKPPRPIQYERLSTALQNMTPAKLSETLANPDVASWDSESCMWAIRMAGVTLFEPEGLTDTFGHFNTAKIVGQEMAAARQALA